MPGAHRAELPGHPGTNLEAPGARALGAPSSLRTRGAPGVARDARTRTDPRRAPWIVLHSHRARRGVVPGEWLAVRTWTRRARRGAHRERPRLARLSPVALAAALAGALTGVLCGGREAAGGRGGARGRRICGVNRHGLLPRPRRHQPVADCRRSRLRKLRRGADGVA